MANMRPDKNPMPHQDPVVRSGNFEEVALGYTKEQAVDEAQRCLNCKNMPCVSGCPVKIHIPEFIAKVAEGDFEAAYQIIAADSALPAVCGRVCPQETQCESKCVRGIKHESVGIGRLERFVADWHNANSTEKPVKPASNGHKVAVIGSGPSGLTCAGDLARKGYEVTVYEALHLAGGVLVYGIPEFRLPKSIVQKEVDGLKELGVKIETNVVVGRSITIDELMEQEGFEAVFIGSGAGLPMFMHIPGENLKGVYSANEFLTRINLMKAYKEGSDTPIMPLKGKKVAVVGGGNVAMDPLLPPSGRRCVHHLPPFRGRASRPCRGGGACQGRGDCLQDPQQPHRDPGLQQPRGQAGSQERFRLRPEVRGDGAGRARRLRPPPSHCEGGQRV